MDLDPSDSMPSIHRNVSLLNETIAAAAATAGAVFVDTTSSFAGYEMCAAEPYANAPFVRAPASPGGALHPNELGHLMMAAALIAAIGGDEQPAARSAPPPDQSVPGPPVADPSPRPNPLTPEERAAVRAILAALLDRIREAVERLGP